jgi:hypothetical protein
LNLKKEEAFGLTAVIIAIVFILILSGSGLTFLDNRLLGGKISELSRSAAGMGLSMAIVEVQNRAGSEPCSDPMWAAFFQDTDINEDGIIARDGETDNNRDGKFDISVVSRNMSLAGRNGADDDGDGIIDDLPGVSGDPEIAPTSEDINGNRRQDDPDGILEDAFGIILTDSYGQIVNEDIGSDGVPNYPYSVPPGHPLYGLYEIGYDPVENLDPHGDNYHPVFNPAGTEGNGKRDPGEPDFNNNGKLDTVENGLQKWLRYFNRISMGTSTPGPGGRSKDFFGNIHVRIIDANGKINLNGPDLLTALLLNYLLKTVKLVPMAFNTPLTPVNESLPEQDDPTTAYIDERGDGKDSDDDSITDDGTYIGFNSRGIEYDCELSATIMNDPSVNQKNNVGITTARADDADAVLIIKYRNSLPGKRFQSLDQLLEVARPGTSIPPDCAPPDQRPLLARKPGLIFGRENINRNPAQTKDQAIYFDNLDEFERLKDFVTIEGWQDTTTVKPAPSSTTGLVMEPRYPVNLNTASKEVLHTVIAIGIKIMDETTFLAAEKLANEIIAYRLRKPFESWNEFEAFMDNAIGTDTPKSFSAADVRLFEKKKSLAAQLKPNTLLQRFNPNNILVRPLDKTHIDTPSTELILGHSGYYEINSLGIITSAVSKGIDDELLTFFYSDSSRNTITGGELGRKEIYAVVKTMDILRHTTQEDFETCGAGTASIPSRTKSLFEVNSYPENMETSEIGMDSSANIALNNTPTAIAVDEITGNVYVGGNTDITGNNYIGIWKYNKSDAPTLSQIGTATISGQAPGTLITFLSIDPLFISTDFGRLYAGILDNNTIKVFDIACAVTTDMVVPKQRKDVEGILGVIPKKIVLNTGRGVITAITSNSTNILEWRYPPADTSAIPEVDDLNTPSMDESNNGIDDDNDGYPDDTAASARGRPETLIDNIDSDGDGEIDDSIRPKPTQPKHPASLSKTPFSVDTGFPIPPVDIVFDDKLEQFFIAGANTIANYRDNVDSHLLEEITRISLPSNVEATAMAVDSSNGFLYIYIIGTGTVGELRKLSTTGTPTAFHESDRLPLGSVTASVKQMVIDENDDLIFILSEGMVTAIHTRNERLQISPVLTAGMETTNAVAIGIDSRRNRVYIAGASPPELKVFEYFTDAQTTMKQTWTDGLIQLSHNSVPLGTVTQVLYSSNFHGDYNLMGANAANQSGTGIPILIGTGTTLIIVSGMTQTAGTGNSLFISDAGTVTARLAPDGAITRTLSASGIASGSVVSYEPEALFGKDPIVAYQEDGRSIRCGAMEFWIKIPQVTNPWAVPEIITWDGKDNDGDGIVDDGGAHPAANPETNAGNHADDDGDGYVDDAIGIGITSKPDEIILARMFYEVPIENEIFVTKNNGVPSREEQLRMIMGTSTMINTFNFDDLTGTYTVFFKLSIKNFEDSNNDGLIDNASLELERFSFPGTITVTGLYTGGIPFNNKPIYPGSATYNITGTTTFTLKPGKWQNIAHRWWIETETTSSNTENVKQDLLINGILVAPVIGGNSINMGTDTALLLGTVSARMGDLNSGISLPIFHIGTKIVESETETSFMATIDDLVIYNGTSGVNGNPKRFTSSFGTSTTDRGESFQDYNLNFRRDASGHIFEDKNRNGFFDAGEAFDMGSATAAGQPYDGSGEFYSFYGELFVSAGTGTFANEYEPGKRYIDYNRNGRWDAGELYLDVNTNGSHEPGTPATNTNDVNRDLRLDDSGYIIRNFEKVLPGGDRIGTVAWTEYLPDKTNVSLELTLKALDGRIMWRWFGGNGTGTGSRIALPVQEASVLGYRANLFAAGTQTESPVIDDVTVTVIKKIPEILSIIEK